MLPLKFKDIQTLSELPNSIAHIYHKQLQILHMPEMLRYFQIYTHCMSHWALGAVFIQLLSFVSIFMC